MLSVIAAQNRNSEIHRPKSSKNYYFFFLNPRIIIVISIIIISCVVCRLTKPLDAERASFPKAGSKFRYAGQTQQQLAKETNIDKPVHTVQRKSGARFFSRGPTETAETAGNLLGFYW